MKLQFRTFGDADEVREVPFGRLETRHGRDADRPFDPRARLALDRIDQADRAHRAVRVPLARHDQVVRDQLDRFRGREVTTTGDGFVAVFDGAERAIRAAQEIGRALSDIGLQARAAVHSGEIEREGGNVRGLTVHIAARLVALAGPGEVSASWATRELRSDSPLDFTNRGLHELKGLSEPRRVHLVEAPT
jgi:class 3 adenylate cyclase